jgi:hypothetical protein
MAKQVQLRRGTTAELSSVTGAEGEVIADTTKDTLTYHDGYTAGGTPLLREDLDNLADQSIAINKIVKGSASQVLKTNGAGTGLEWGSASITDASLMQYSGALLGVEAYTFTSRFSTSFSNSWTNYFTGTFNKKSASSLIIAQIVLAEYSESNGSGNTRLVFGSSTQYGQYNYGISGHTHAHPRLFAISGNTATGTINWQYAQEQASCTIVNPTTSDDSRLTQGSFSRVVIWEIKQ